jgi:hypothetical protein
MRSSAYNPGVISNHRSLATRRGDLIMAHALLPEIWLAITSEQAFEAHVQRGLDLRPRDSLAHAQRLQLKAVRAFGVRIG